MHAAAAAILAVLDTTDTPLTTTALETATAGAHARDVVRLALKYLVEAGDLMPQPGPRRAIYYRRVRDESASARQSAGVRDSEMPRTERVRETAERPYRVSADRGLADSLAAYPS
jgi:hypothetical protein